jgi:cell division protein FtsW
MSDKERTMHEEALQRTPILEGDRTLWIIYAALIVISVLVVYSSTAKMAYDIGSSLTTTESLRQQIMLILVVSIPVVFICHKINHNFYHNITKLLYWSMWLLTLATYFVGVETNGAARWLPIGPFQFQPSEILKVATIMLIARNMADRQKNIDKINLLPTSFHIREPKQWKILKENTWPILGPMVMSCIIIAPSHISSALIIALTSMIMLFIGRASLKEIGKICGISKRLTSHLARHTAATLMLNAGISMEVVSKILGHSNLRMTAHYAKLMDKTILNTKIEF